MGVPAVRCYFFSMVTAVPIVARFWVRTPLAFVAVAVAVAAAVAAGCGPTKDPWPKAAPDSRVRSDVETKEITSAIAYVPEGPTVSELGDPCEDQFAGKKINLDAQEQEVGSLLTAVANHGGIAVVFDTTASAKVTVQLHEVPLRDAIEALAKAGGLRTELRGCTFHIVSDALY